MTDFGGAIKEAHMYDIAIMGVPYDGKSSYLSGPAEGPQAIRAASTGQAINAWTELGINLEEAVTITDLGDVDAAGDFSEISSRVEEKVLEVLEKRARPIVLGGDHSISLPVARAMGKKHSSLDILHFDAHPDLYEELYGDRFSHACPFARILDEGLAKNLVQVGIRASTGEHRDKSAAFGVQTVAMKDWKEDLALAFSNPLYISFDADVLDPAFAPGVSHHEPGGLSTRQVINLLHRLEADVVGMDVVEVNPTRDVSGITAAAAVKIIMEAAAKMAITIQEKRKKEDK
ncbi:MAG: agmatinase [Candidatus Aminicenantes bacterium]|jgi:agmatinase